MTDTDPKAVLHRYLDMARDAVVWKLDGLSEYDVRRPLVATGTNLLGLVKHLACVEAGYLGEVFDRPFPDLLPPMDLDADPNADLWATADESRHDILDLYARVRAHADATIEALELDARGHVRWWGDAEVTLLRILVHVTTETHRHAGHADLVRELIDGAAGFLPGRGNLPDEDAVWWQAHHERVEQAAREASDHRT